MSEIAREAGALLMRHFWQPGKPRSAGRPQVEAKVSIEYKGEVDLVTAADRESEALIAQRIRERWPGHDIVGEEGTRQESGSEFRWYVDPLDGTTNFAHGFPVFCVSMALENVRAGEVVAGVIFDPARDELFAAERGSGATLNGQPIRVSSTAKLAESLVATGFPSHKRHQNPNIHFYHQITLRTHGVRRAGSAALDLANTACGRFDGFWEFNLNAWDISAGVLLVREAGGRVTDFSGRPFDHRAPRETLATNGLIHDALLSEIQAILNGRVEGLPDPVAYARTRSS